MNEEQFDALIEYINAAMDADKIQPSPEETDVIYRKENKIHKYYKLKKLVVE